ncbi:type IV pilin accessory protein [Acinetobacter sp. NCu2D-2]|uniref:TfpX/TfpZ family type IV pilin accessory protein n=1 Tax=Acinetobacter sp. NCu2D-2 TaxID=1608473 RepID=UPI0007CDBCBE|nr:TfpX/TfpZ family type IV pilin accessory protein [Acinetobacter sp. NCu2D-2]ANF82667.1 type IV pilin accessory protein [Acinetobacter sp. NCu2D-2]
MSKRLRFFVGHLVVSLCIALVVLSLVYGLWYPAPFAMAVGVTPIFLMLLATDVVLGPLLGFVVYKKAKKSLKFDLSIIILIQISALSFGIYNIAQARPAWIVFNTDRFELIRNTDLILSEKKPETAFSHVGWFGPKWAAVKVASDVEQKNEDLFVEALGGISIAQRPERYFALKDIRQDMVYRAQDLHKLEAFNESIHVKSFLQKYSQANAWLPLKANAVDMVVRGGPTCLNN